MRERARRLLILRNVDILKDSELCNEVLVMDVRFLGE